MHKIKFNENSLTLSLFLLWFILFADLAQTLQEGAKAFDNFMWVIPISSRKKNS